jgi:tRNA (guanine37-N1)-methyltransferase
MFPGPLGHSLAGKALKEGRWRLKTVDIRALARDKHASVDDAPYGGGPGMVMRPEPLDAALEQAQAGASPGVREIYLSPRGRRLTQHDVRSMAAAPGLIVLCGRYEGVDERLIAARGLEEVSIGDFVLSGGEPAAIVLIDAVVRLLPGVMGNAAAAQSESFEDGRLEHPHYTRPEEWRGHRVPDVLRSGDHGRIAAWRREQADAVTAARRPDLWETIASSRTGRDERFGSGQERS